MSKSNTVFYIASEKARQRFWFPKHQGLIENFKPGSEILEIGSEFGVNSGYMKREGQKANWWM